MAESLVQVTEGVGKKLHTFARTIGANTVEDEVVLLGENYLAGYTVSHANASALLTTANSHLLQIMAGASLKVRIRRIEMYQHGLATTASFTAMQLFRLTTAGTGGTAFTPAPLDPGDAASGATAMTLPAVKGTEAAAVAGGSAYLVQTAGASTAFPQPILVWDFDRPRTKPLIIAAGAANGIAVKNIGAIANASVSFMVWLDETNF
jgi:hypothetical protein